MSHALVQITHQIKVGISKEEYDLLNKADLMTEERVTYRALDVLRDGDYDERDEVILDIVEA